MKQTLKKLAVAIMAVIVITPAFAQVETFASVQFKKGAKSSELRKILGNPMNTTTYTDDSCELGIRSVWQSTNGKEIVDVQFCNDKLVSHRVSINK